MIYLDGNHWVEQSIKTTMSTLEIPSLHEESLLVIVDGWYLNGRENRIWIGIYVCYHAILGPIHSNSIFETYTGRETQRYSSFVLVMVNPWI